MNYFLICSGGESWYIILNPLESPRLCFLTGMFNKLMWIPMMITCWGWWFFPMFLHMSFSFPQESQETIIIQVHDIVLMRPCSNTTDPAYTASSQWLVSSTFGGFLKWGYPQIIILNRIFHYKWGAPILGNTHSSCSCSLWPAKKTRNKRSTQPASRIKVHHASSHIKSWCVQTWCVPSVFPFYRHFRADKNDKPCDFGLTNFQINPHKP